MLKAKLKAHPALIELLKKEKETGKTGDDQGKVKTSRDPTPAPGKLREKKDVHKSERVEASKPIDSKACPHCNDNAKKFEFLKQSYSHELSSMSNQVYVYQQVLTQIKKYLNLTGDIDFTISDKRPPKGSLHISNFADKVHLMFRRMYADLEK